MVAPSAPNYLSRRIGTAAAHVDMVVLKKLWTVPARCSSISLLGTPSTRHPSDQSATPAHGPAAARPAASAAASAATSSRRPARDGLLLHALKKNSATQSEKATLKAKKNRKRKAPQARLPALKLAIAQNPIKGFFKRPSTSPPRAP